MQILQKKEIRLLFSAGSLKEAIITRHPLDKEQWMLGFSQYNGGFISLRSQRDNKRCRRFMTLDAAVNFAEQMGFRRVLVEL